MTPELTVITPIIALGFLVVVGFLFLGPELRRERLMAQSWLKELDDRAKARMVQEIANTEAASSNAINAEQQAQNHLSGVRLARRFRYQDWYALTDEGEILARRGFNEALSLERGDPLVLTPLSELRRVDPDVDLPARRLGRTGQQFVVVMSANVGCPEPPEWNDPINDNDRVHRQGRGVIAAGTTTDFASIPAGIRWLVGGPTGRVARAGVAHDHGYRTDTGPHLDRVVRSRAMRKAWDFHFLHLMRLDGVGPMRRFLMYAAVRIFGWRAWRRSSQALAVSAHKWLRRETARYLSESLTIELRIPTVLQHRVSTDREPTGSDQAQRTDSQ